MEANCEPQHRTKVNSRKAVLPWVSVLENATPYFQSWAGRSESGSGGKSWSLTP